MRIIRLAIVLTALVSVLIRPAQAGYDEAMAAYKATEYQAAFDGWKLLALDGDARSQYWLGLMLANGTGVKQDVVTALAWLTLSKNGGVKQAAEYAQVLQDNYMPRYCVYEAVSMVRAFENGAKANIEKGTRQNSRCWQFTTTNRGRLAQ